METWAGRRGTIGPRDAGRALDAARDGGAAPSLIADDDAAAVLLAAIVWRIGLSLAAPRGTA